MDIKGLIKYLLTDSDGVEQEFAEIDRDELEALTHDTRNIVIDDVKLFISHWGEHNRKEAVCKGICDELESLKQLEE